MKVIIETPRLLLRAFLPSDAIGMYTLNADPEVIQYTGDVPFSSIQDAQVFIDSYDHYDQHGYGRWTCLLRDQTYIGWCGLKYHQSQPVDIGFRFLREYWGQGYATEAARASLEYGFTSLDLTEIMGRADQDNLASVRVLQKIGMTFWKVGSTGHISNAVFYKINATDFRI